MSAVDLLQPDPEPSEESPKTLDGSKETLEDAADDEIDLEALRAAALKSIKPKKPLIQENPRDSDLLEIVPAGQSAPTRPAAVRPHSIPQRTAYRPPGGYRPPLIRTPAAAPVIPFPPPRFDRPPPGFPYYSPPVTTPVVAPIVSAAVAAAPLLTFPPPLPEYYGVRRRSRSPYSHSRHRYSRSPSPRRHYDSSRRRPKAYDSFSDSETEEEIEEDIEVTATESEGEEEKTDEKPDEEKKERAKEEMKEEKVKDNDEPDDVLNVHAEVDEFSSLLDTTETKPGERPAKKKKTKIVKRMVRRKKKRPSKRPLSPVRKWRRSSPPRRRSKSPRRPRSPRFGRRKSQSPENRRQPSRGKSEPKSDVDKSKSCPPSRRSESKEETPKETEEDREERQFQERLAKTKSQDEKDRMVSRRNKFQSSKPVGNGTKVISLKETKKESDDTVEIGVNADDMFEDDAKLKGSVTDLRVQLHRKRMMRSSKDKSPMPKKRFEKSDDDDDKIGRMRSEQSPKKKLKNEGRKIVISKAVRSSSDSEEETILLKKSSKSNIMSRLGDPVHHKKTSDSEEKRIYYESSEGEIAKDSSPENKKSKKKKKEKKKDKLQRKLEKKLKKLKEQVSSLRGEAEKSDKIDKLLSTSSLSDILSDSPPLKQKKKSAKTSAVSDKGVDESEEALFAFFENDD